MTRAGIQANRNEFDAYMKNGGEVLIQDKQGTWRPSLVPFNQHDHKYVLVDKYVEHRKTLAEGGKLEVLYRGNEYSTIVGYPKFNVPANHYRKKQDSMYEAMMKDYGIHSVIADIAFHSMKADKNHPVPNIYRHSGKSTYNRLILISQILEGKIEEVLFQDVTKPIHRTKLDKVCVYYDNGSDNTRVEKRRIEKALDKLGVQFKNEKMRITIGY